MLTLPHALYRCVPSVSGSLAREPEGVQRGELLLCVYLGSCLSVLWVSLTMLHTCSANSVGQGTVLLMSNLSVHVCACQWHSLLMSNRYIMRVGEECTRVCTHGLVYSCIAYAYSLCECYTCMCSSTRVCAFVYSCVTHAWLARDLRVHSKCSWAALYKTS